MSKFYKLNYTNFSLLPQLFDKSFNRSYQALKFPKFLVLLGRSWLKWLHTNKKNLDCFKYHEIDSKEWFINKKSKSKRNILSEDPFLGQDNSEKQIEKCFANEVIAQKDSELDYGYNRRTTSQHFHYLSHFFTPLINSMWV